MTNENNLKALDVLEVFKTYPNQSNPSQSVEALKGLSFFIKPGEIFGLLGPNGAGKTSLISCITTLEKPTKGDIQVFGVSVNENPFQIKKNIGVVQQEIINTGFFDVIEILEFQSGFYGLKNNRDQIHFLLDRLSLKAHAHKKLKQLSGGMKRRLMIAKALVHNPKLLLLDEPTAGVDVELRESLWIFVQELQKQGMSILLTTHYLQEAENLCHRIGIINKGELQFCGEPDLVIKKYSTKKTQIKLQSGELLEFISPATETLQELFVKHKISIDQVLDIKMQEGHLEEAFSKVVKS